MHKVDLSIDRKNVTIKRMKEPTNKEILKAVEESQDAISDLAEATARSFGVLHGQINDVREDVKGLRQDVINQHLLQHQIDEIKERLEMR